jgi:HK97 family phage prohead protease
MTERGPIEIRSAPVASVDYPERVLSLILAPFDEWAVVETRTGALIEERIERGAFGAIRNRARKFTVNYDHDPERWLGTVLDLDPEDPRGLVGTVKIRRSPDGDQALNDCADGLLGASIGMAVAPGDETVANGRRVIRKAFLDHVALTPTPAYVGAEVLEVRTAPPAIVPPVLSSTPNLDKILAERREEEYRALLK